MPSWCAFDIADLESQLAELERKSAEPDLWQDQERAQRLMRQMGGIRGVIERWRGMESRVSDALTLAQLSVEEEDPSVEGEIEAEIERVSRELERQEFELLLGGEYDSRNAILAIHAGAGGTEAQDWAEMLLRMYLRWAEQRGYKAEVLEASPGEEAGIKSATVEVVGDHAYGYLKSERGVHRLVRLSPFDADHARHTSFVLVEVMPEAEHDVEVSIGPDDLKVDFFRASGPGGQHVQKTSTAVRVTHVPSGVVVTCQNERSQFQNRETAMRVLRARLLEVELANRAEEQARLKGEHVSAGWGNQIRSYVLHPYKMVKDHRTGLEVHNPTAVLDGDIDPFIEAYLKTTIGEEGQ